MRYAIPAIFLAVVAATATAQDLAPSGQSEPKRTAPPSITMEAFGNTFPACAEWYDDCQVCKRDEDGKPHCSTPGIACRQGTIVCLSVRTTTPGSDRSKAPDAAKPDDAKAVKPQ